MADMYYLPKKEDSIEALVSEFTESLDSSGSTHDVEWIDGLSGRTPVISRLRDEYTLDIVNFFIHGGCWEMVHQIGCETPQYKLAFDCKTNSNVGQIYLQRERVSQLDLS